MKRTWYKRLLLSYLPILFITVSVMIFIFVSIISQYSIAETQNANRVFIRYVTDSINTNLKQVENSLLASLSNDFSNDALYNFFNSQPQNTIYQRLIDYEASKNIRDMIDNNPIISSIYLYRAADQMVLTSYGMVKLQDFQDKDYINEVMASPSNPGWSPVRTYSDSPIPQYQKRQVITIAKKVQIPLGKQGIAVINVDVSSLLDIVNQMINSDITFVNIWDANHTKVYPLNDSQPSESVGKTATRIHLDYVNWDLESGIKSGKWFSWVAVISRYWFAIGAFAIALSAIYLIYVTRRNYRPIENIVEKLHTFQADKGRAGDEFSFIGKVLTGLMSQASEYEKLYQEDLIVRRKQFFQELIEGKTNVTNKDWQTNMGRFNMRHSFRHFAVAVVEIDGYGSFCRQYNKNDQNLLKFALTYVTNEFAQDAEQVLWGEWTEANRVVILYMDSFEEEQYSKLYHLLDKFRTWVAVNLKFSVTVGLGKIRGEVSDISQSYKEAVVALKYKMSLGGNQVLSFEEFNQEAQGDTHKYIQLMNTVLQDFRVMNPSWNTNLEQFSQILRQDVLKDEEIQYLFRYFIRLFQREMEKLPEEAAAYWSDQVLPKLTLLLKEAETMDDLLPAAPKMLNQLYERYLSASESKSNHQLILDIRKYIEAHYDNPELSLNHISDRFEINAKYVSQLFKDEFNMKFIDFLVELRMERAKQLLATTDDPIQEISTKIGYANAISFGRTFKKITGVTPGDYRKHMQDLS